MFERIYENKDDFVKLPVDVQKLYVEREGKFIFNGVKECGHENVATLERTLERGKEERNGARTERDTVKSELDKWTALGDFDDVSKMTKDYPVLKANASGDNAERFNQAVLEQVTRLREKDNRDATTDADKIKELTEKVSGYERDLNAFKFNERLSLAMDQAEIKDAGARKAMQMMTTGLFETDAEGDITAVRDAPGVQKGTKLDVAVVALKGEFGNLFDGSTIGTGAKGSDGTIHNDGFDPKNPNKQAQLIFEIEHGAKAADQRREKPSVAPFE